MKRLKNLVVTKEGRFEVLGIVSIRVPGHWWWHADELGPPGGDGGLIFRCYGDPAGREEVAYLLVTDVSDDPDEIDISMTEQIGAADFDKILKNGVSQIMMKDGRKLLKWTSSQLTETLGRKLLVTAYTGLDGARERQYVDCRTTACGRKLIIGGCFDVGRANEFAVPIVSPSSRIRPPLHRFFG